MTIGGLVSSRATRRPAHPGRLGWPVGLLAALSVAALLVVPAESVALVTGGGAATTGLEAEPDAHVLAGVASAEVPPPVPPSSTTLAATRSTAPPPAAAAGSPRSSPTAAAPKPPAAPPSPAVIDTGLWLGEAGGPVRQLASEADWSPLAWSPDSRAVALARRGAVVLLDPVTATRRQVLDRPGATVLRGAWSPEGRTLAVLVLSGTKPSIAVVDVASGVVTEVAATNAMTGLGYSPAGCLAFADSSQGQAGIAQLCPGQPRRLIPLRIGALAGVLPGLGFVFTQDGPNGIAVVDFEGRPLPGVAGPTSLYGGEMAWDPAQGELVWRGAHGGNRPRVELYASRLGGATTTVSRCSASPPTASTNGIVAYVDACGTARAVLQRRPSGGAPQGVATLPYHRGATPLISPDGRWLVVKVAPF
jgi:hypothetical protein